MWNGATGPILYAGIIDSPFNDEYNSRFFLNNTEVSREGLTGSFDAIAAVRIDSIYIGVKAISVQVKLYEANLEQREKRVRVL